MWAGLCVAPFGVVLALSGSAYLFRPQIENLIQSRIDQGRTVASRMLPADSLVAAAANHLGDAELLKYRLPEPAHATAQIELITPSGEKQLVWVDRGSGAIAYTMASNSHPMELAKQLHGELLAGSFGSVFVEIAACWMILLLATGAYLAWPRRGRWIQLFLPRLGRRATLRSLHVSVGAWIGGFALVFLLSGLPWTGILGSGIQRVQQWTGTDGPGQEFRVTLQSSAPSSPGMPEVRLEDVLELSSAAELPGPVEVSPPRGSSGVWTVRAMTQRRPDRVTLHYDRYTGAEIMRISFDDYPRFKQAISVGIALHEGQLFGVPNQILGVLVALGVMTLCVTGPLLWWKRRPSVGRDARIQPVEPASHMARRRSA